MRRRSSQLWMPHPHIQVFFILANLVFNLMSDDPVTKKCVANCGNPPTPFQLPRVIILIESYDELSAAADRGVGELRLMTLGNQGSS